ncbi:UDP-N-acetylmuramate--L-alanine ligase [Clostridium tetani]|uniref:UDP-N-acetylmuramate--L-alanine ligase n=1 Tax=Clostridium tetani TaxID=1513 RepID=UPI00100B01EC|nr:UDP-N-acetylmuramate--L-alanine ligase [Clostridium tetani]RXI40551.1 UDP-N-acetylmuramate--L-alanine ligase [Clostridium tetani]
MSFDFLKYIKKVHFIGIGGISMSGMAEILLKKGYEVSGSDSTKSPITDKLIDLGAKIYIGHKAENIKNVDLIVYTAAVSEDNPELKKALTDNIKTMNRAEFLGYLMDGHKYNIAVSGTHGKTTTTSMMSHITVNANLDPTILVGGELNIINGNVRTGKSEYFLTEACEYKESFLKFFPYIGVILNIDADHLDYYKDINHIKNAFSKFANLIPKGGYLIACAEDENINDIIKNIDCTIITYGLNKGDIQAKNITFDNKGCASFDVVKDSSVLFSVKLNVPGNYNVLNALASICVSFALNIDKESIIKGLESFYGTHRRFELKGIRNDVTVIEDYAHHPTEIKATLSAAKNYPSNRILCVFQPHTYTRTYSLFEDFTESFYNTDTLILADIYPAREKDTGIVSSDMLGNKLREKNVNCINLHSFEDISDYLKKETKPGDLVLIMGAGDIYKAGDLFLK